MGEQLGKRPWKKPPPSEYLKGSCKENIWAHKRKKNAGE
jgi:hypothetical protein